MEQLILIVHVLIALAIIGLILIQQGKGADMGASFGAGASQTLFGSTGSGNVLTKSTAILVTLFFITSFALAYVAKQKSIDAGSVDLPVPAVIESREAPAAELDIPVGSEQPAISDIPAADIPAVDIPAVNDADIPE